MRKHGNPSSGKTDEKERDLRKKQVRGKPLPRDPCSYPTPVLLFCNTARNTNVSYGAPVFGSPTDLGRKAIALEISHPP